MALPLPFFERNEGIQMRFLILLLLASCERAHPVLRPISVSVFPEFFVPLVQDLAYDMNNDSLCDWITVTPYGLHEIVIDTEAVEDVTFPARRDCVYGYRDDASIVMVDPRDGLGAYAWGSAFYHQLGHVLGLEHEQNGIMRYDTGGLRGEAARKSLLAALADANLPVCVQ